MSDPRVEAAIAMLTQFCDEYEQLSGLDPEVVYGLHRGHPKQCEVRLTDLRTLLDAVSEYEAVVTLRCDYCGHNNEVENLFRRIEHGADTRALIANRTPAETAEAKAWSDDAHARIRAGEVSGSHDLMRAKVGEYRANMETT